MEDSERTGRLKKISRWLKPRHFIPSIQQEDGTFEGSPIKVAQQLREAWGNIAHPSSRPLLTDDVVQQMTARLRRQPWAPEEIKPEDLRRIALGNGDSAMGPDRIPWKVLSVLPLEGWRRLVQVLEVVEATGVWPTPLLAISLVPVPKSEDQGPVKPEKMRMISVSSHVYRIQASLRADQLATWASSVIPKKVHGGVRNRSAAKASHQESLQWDVQAAADAPWMSAFCDASKCFDLLRYQDLQKVMAALGIDGVFLQALRSWQENQSRWVTVDGWTASQPISRGEGFLRDAHYQFCSVASGEARGSVSLRTGSRDMRDSGIMPLSIWMTSHLLVIG